MIIFNDFRWNPNLLVLKYLDLRWAKRSSGSYALLDTVAADALSVRPLDIQKPVIRLHSRTICHVESMMVKWSCEDVSCQFPSMAMAHFFHSIVLDCHWMALGTMGVSGTIFIQMGPWGIWGAHCYCNYTKTEGGLLEMLWAILVWERIF